MSVEVEAVIDTDGKVTLSVRGAKDKQCLSLTRDIEKALGGKVLERTETGEMKQAATTTTQAVAQTS